MSGYVVTLSQKSATLTEPIASSTIHVVGELSGALIF